MILEWERFTDIIIVSFSHHPEDGHTSGRKMLVITK